MGVHTTLAYIVNIFKEKKGRRRGQSDSIGRQSCFRKSCQRRRPEGVTCEQKLGCPGGKVHRIEKNHPDCGDSTCEVLSQEQARRPACPERSPAEA